MTQASNSSLTMKDIADQFPDSLVPFSVGQVVEAEIISTNKHRVLLDVAGVAIGLVPEREFSYDVDDLNPKDKVLAYVLNSENQEGYAILSLKRADKERVWITLAQKQSSGEPIKVKIITVNRGGIVVEFGGIEGFIPQSQLTIDTNDKNAAKSLVGNFIMVKVISADKVTNKLIFSQKSVGDERVNKLIGEIAVSTKLKGVISGIVDFGLFIKVNLPSNDDVEGLVHISEVSWDRVENLHDLFKIGQMIDVVVISNQGGRLSFSIKKLTPDPWSQAAEKYQPQSIVKGEVTRVTPFGAFVKLSGNLDGLVHISELGDKVEDPNKIVSEGKSYDFRILSVDAKARKISLSLKLKAEKKSTLKTEKAVNKPSKVKSTLPPTKTKEDKAAKKTKKTIVKAKR